MRVPGHAARVTVERDPEGNFWTVECECGEFEESGSSQQVVRSEHRWHKQVVLKAMGHKFCADCDRLMFLDDGRWCDQGGNPICPRTGLTHRVV